MLRRIEMDDKGAVPARVPYGTHIWNLPSVIHLKMITFRNPPQLFRSPKLLHYSSKFSITLLQLRELMLHSPLLQELELYVYNDDQNEWKTTEIKWFHDLVKSRTITTNNHVSDAACSSYSSIWPSLTQFHARAYLLAMLQITVLPIVNQLRQVSLLMAVSHVTSFQSCADLVFQTTNR
jgi:hypothetical protein